ncbi:PD-(D/E)XK nuclease family protein [Chitinophaga niabensis]|uniref:RecB family exonuclease n=1 Tax=Chitinophaga niabensis TaxID=536979 RepID=UPI0031B9C66D
MKHTFPEDEPILVFTGLTIHTVHSFCERVMREHPALFDTKGLITPLEKIRLIKSIIDGFSKDNPLKRYRGDVYAALHPLTHLFSRIKSGQEETATPEFHTYQQMLLAAGKYDMDDIISLLEQTPELLLKYKEQLQYATGTTNRLTELLGARMEPPKQEDTPGSRHTLNILRYIAAEQEIPGSGEDLLFEIMHDANFQIPPVEAAKICRQAADQRTTIRAYLQQPRIPSLFSTGPHENALQLSNLLEKWMKLPLPELLQALPQSGVLKEEVRRNPDLTLSALMESVDLAEKLPITNQRIAPEIEKMDPLFIDPLLKDFTMSATILNNYLRCPLAFFYQQLIKAPMGRQENLAFGSAAHHALEKLFQKMQITDVFPSLEVFLQDFDTYMLDNRAAFTSEAFERRMEYGHRILSSYYTRYIHEWNPIVSVERTFRNISVNGVPVKGKIDKLEFDGKRVNIVDYKTGDYERTKFDWKKFAPPEEKLPRGGDYWRQGVFYKILLDNYKQKDWLVVSTEFDFIEPGRNGEYFKEKINITPADITTVTQQITESWERIQQRDFYTGCGKPYCEWCNFVKNNHLQVALHTLAAPEEEE